MEKINLFVENNNQFYFSAIFFIFSIFLIDRITKILMIHFAEILGKTTITVTPFLNLNLIWNNP